MTAGAKKRAVTPRASHHWLRRYTTRVDKVGYRRGRSKARALVSRAWSFVPIRLFAWSSNSALWDLKRGRRSPVGVVSTGRRSPAPERNWQWALKTFADPTALHKEACTKQRHMQNDLSARTSLNSRFSESVVQSPFQKIRAFTKPRSLLDLSRKRARKSGQKPGPRYLETGCFFLSGREEDPDMVRCAYL